VGAAGGVAFGWFPLLAEIGQFLAVFLLRILVLAAPIVGLVMILYHRFAPNMLRALGRMLGAALFLTVGSTLYLMMLQAVLSLVHNPALQIIIMLVVMVLALVLVKPFKQLTGMVGGLVSAAGFEQMGNTVSSMHVPNPLDMGVSLQLCKPEVCQDRPIGFRSERTLKWVRSHRLRSVLTRTLPVG
jgi:hypothetical protein